MAENIHWHTLSVEETFRKLGTGIQGLSSSEAKRRLEEYGPNEIEEKKGIRVHELLLHQLKNPLIGVLAAAMIISVVAGKNLDAVVIGVIIILNTLIGFYQEFQAERALESLKSLAAPEAEVIRDCRDEDECTEQRIKSSQIVPGDILFLEAGDIIPADARVIDAKNLEIDESMLTGESTPVEKSTQVLSAELGVTDRTNLLYSGSVVTQGRGRAVVYATGKSTELGKIAGLIEGTEKADPPLKKRTVDLSKRLGLLALGASTLTIVLGHLRSVEVSELLLFAIAMAVSAIPEGLPAVMSITLAIGVHRMARRKAIIRKIQAVDTLGSATLICTDKTGTLTTNEMTVRRLFVNGSTVDVSGVGFAPKGTFSIDDTEIDPSTHEHLLLLLKAGALCNDARLRDHITDGQHQWSILGDPTEGALVVATAKAGIRRSELEQEYPRIEEIPFSAKHRYMVTFHEPRVEDKDEVFVFTKGAPETILGMCSHALKDGHSVSLDQDDKEEVLQVATELAGQALRVLALAYAHIPKDSVEEKKKAIQEGQADLTLIGLSGSIDPPRDEVPVAIELCQRAGIRVLMLTGDHQLTAEAIAREIGILKKGQSGLSGSDVDEMDDDELGRALQETQVWARVSPQHKHRLVEACRRLEHIVAMTGDGVNDAPALKAAEIGIAMGISGSEVTKDIADMVLTDDNFASIVNAVEEGRVVFENVRKVVRFLVTTNIGEIMAILVSLLILPAGQLIFTPIQILWVNLVTDGLLDKSLAVEPKEGDVMDLPPRKPKERIINRDVLLSISYVAVIMAAGTLFMVCWFTNSVEVIKAQTVGFTTMAMFQVFNAFNCRSNTKSIFTIGPFSNKYLLLAVVGSIILQVSATVVPFLQSALGTVPLSPADWGAIFLVSSSVLWADELRKQIRGRFSRRQSA